MEPQHYYHNHHHQTQNNGNHEDGGGSKSGGAGYICRQTSTRWTPTTEQIRILKELYYNNGVRSPSAEQIQRISAKLRQYGKIEGKNVFYWFQNHKARERQKKRLTAAAPDAAAAFSMQMQRGVWRSAAADHCSTFNNIPQASSVGQIGNYGYGSTVAMERSFKNCSISAGGGSNGNGGCVAAAAAHQNYGWVGIAEHHHPYAAASAAQYYHPFLDHKIRTVHHHHADEDHETLEDLDQDNYNYDNKSPETLPLFPIHADHHTTAGSGGGGCYYYTNPDQWYNGGGSRAAAASLELSLSSSYNLGNTSSSHHFA